MTAAYLPPVRDDAPEAPAPAAPLRDLAADTPAPDDTGLSGVRIRVELEDGTAYEVRIDNRDYVRWDMTAPRQKWGNGADVPFLFQTFLAWAASKRQGLTALSWDAFERACVLAAMQTPDEDDVTRPTR